MKIAIVTGASSGLGREYVQRIAAAEDIEAIWAIARREDRLAQLAEEISVPLRPLALDLAKAEGIDVLAALLAEEKPEVLLLVNAAGFGVMGRYDSISLEDSMGMVDLNCRGLVAVTHTVLPYMARGGRILQIASTSAFQPFQTLNVYAASKAFVLRYSRGLRWELMGSGIRVSAICPYWIKDTEFIDKARQNGDPNAIHAFPLASRSKNVVAFSLACSKLNLPVVTPGIVCSLHRIVAKFIPHELLQAAWSLLRRA